MEIEKDSESESELEVEKDHRRLVRSDILSIHAIDLLDCSSVNYDSFCRLENEYLDLTVPPPELLLV